MKNKLNKLIVIFCLATPCFLIAQNRFKAGLIVGVNAAQINGDNQDGYNKIGLSFGIRGGFDIAETADLTAELFYNNKGARVMEANAKDNSQFLPNVKIHQADVIVMFNKYLRPKNPEDQPKTIFNVGLSYGRILQTETEVFQRRAAVPQVATFLNDNFNKQDFSLIVGVSYLFTKRLGVSLRHTVSLGYLYQRPDEVPPSEKVGNFRDLRPYNLSAQVFYNFLLPKVKFVSKRKKKTNNDANNPLERL